MRLLVVSDTHNDSHTLYDLVTSKSGKFDVLLHLGDGADDVEELRYIYPMLDIYFVSGNCDGLCRAAGSAVIELEGVKIFMTHGHLFGVNYSLDSLYTKAREEGASLALFGHTHHQLCRFEHNVTVLNPGSLCRPRDGRRGYAEIEIRDRQPICTLQRL